MKDLVIIVLCYNSKEHLPRCMDSLKAAMSNINASAILVDNASTDGSANYIQETYSWCTLIRSNHNAGYSYGNNLGLKAAGFPDNPLYSYVMLLNPDTEMPEDTLHKMLEYMHKHSDIGVIGPKLVLPDGTLDKACKRGSPNPTNAFFHFSGLARIFPYSPFFARYNMTFVGTDKIHDVDSTVGACQLIRAEALTKVGLLDEQFFMYGEDLDINIRIGEAGYRVLYYPRVVVKHLKGSSTRKEPENMVRAFYESMKIFHRKHYASEHTTVLNAIVYLVVDIICYYKLFYNRIIPASRRTVGSTPKSQT